MTVSGKLAPPLLWALPRLVKVHAATLRGRDVFPNPYSQHPNGRQHMFPLLISPENNANHFLKWKQLKILFDDGEGASWATRGRIRKWYQEAPSQWIAQPTWLSSPTINQRLNIWFSLFLGPHYILLCTLNLGEKKKNFNQPWLMAHDCIKWLPAIWAAK